MPAGVRGTKASRFVASPVAEHYRDDSDKRQGQGRDGHQRRCSRISPGLPRTPRAPFEPGCRAGQSIQRLGRGAREWLP
jgi:hypothetical protein